MSDFERRLHDALDEGAESAPDGSGLAEGARRRLGTRRRRRTTTGAVLAVVAIALPLGLLGSGDGGPGRQDGDQEISALENHEVTCGGASWPASAMDGGVPGLAQESDVRAAFAAVLGEAPMDAPQAIREQGPERAPYIALAETDDGLILGTGTWTTAGPGEDADYVRLEKRADGGLRATGWGDCQLRVALPPGRSPVEVEAPRGGVDPTTTHPVIMVNERDCTSGRDPAPFLSRPEVVEDDRTVLVTMSSQTLTRPADCQGNPSVPVTLDLDRPIGDRQLLDGGTWPPTPLTVRSAAGWHTVEHEGVVVDVPGDWTRLDTPGCEFELVRYGPPGSDPCDYDGESLNFYGSATFDPAHGPGLRKEGVRWAGYVYTGDWAVYTTAVDRDQARRILGSARQEGQESPDLSAGWRTESYDGLSIDVPADWRRGSLATWCVDDAVPGWVERPGTNEADVDCPPPASGHGIRFGTGVRDDWIRERHGPEYPDGSWAGVAIAPDGSGKPLGFVQVVAPTQALAELIGGSLRAD